MIVAFDVVVAPLIRAGLDGHLGAHIKALFDAHRIADVAHRDLDYYVRNVRVVVGRAVIVTLGVALLGAALAARRWLVDRTKRQLRATASPINLAVLRVVIFGLLWFEVERVNAVFYSALPAELLMPPVGLNWFPHTLPVDPRTTEWVLLVARTTCLAAILGFLTRLAGPMAVLASAWIIAVPQLYGKVNHDHHVLWFAALLAVGPCADVLAVDGVAAALRRADRGDVRAPTPSRAYALPILFIWILLGAVYFFPGFWKAWTTGFTWISPENLRHHMYLKWQEFDGGWTPTLRIDGMPVLLALGAFCTVAFELSFIALVLSSRLRAFAALGGLCFHNACGYFLRIPFWSLQVSYAALVDWGDVLPRFGRMLFRRRLHLVYDGGCLRCRRLVASLATIDALDGVTLVDRLDPGRLRQHGLDWCAGSMREDHVVAVSGPRTWRGFPALRAATSRLPVIWPVVPLLHVWPLSALAAASYERIAHPPSSPCVADAGQTRATTQFVPWEFALGGALVVGAIATGAGVSRLSWPIAQYPTFAAIAKGTTTALEIVVEEDGGTERIVDVRTLNAWHDDAFRASRLAALVDRILETPEPSLKTTRLVALWKTLSPIDPSLQRARVVRFFRDTVPTAPERREDPPIARELVLELRPEPDIGSHLQRLAGAAPRSSERGVQGWVHEEVEERRSH